MALEKCNHSNLKTALTIHDIKTIVLTMFGGYSGCLQTLEKNIGQVLLLMGYNMYS
jgi:hypothetical protein